MSILVSDSLGSHHVVTIYMRGTLVPLEALRDGVTYTPLGGARTLPQSCTLVSELILLYFSIPSFP